MAITKFSITSEYHNISLVSKKIQLYLERESVDSKTIDPILISLMEALNNSIEHCGVIKEVTQKTIKVSLLNISGCASCHTKSTCSVSDIDNKVIDVINPGVKFNTGDKVKVAFEKSLAPLALIIGYLAPFILLMAVLLVSLSVTNDEVFSGIASLFSVGVYYLILTLFRNKLKSTFTFRILKDQHTI
jgi:positive regulator of sigma E activity